MTCFDCLRNKAVIRHILNRNGRPYSAIRFFLRDCLYCTSFLAFDVSYGYGNKGQRGGVKAESTSKVLFLLFQDSARVGFMICLLRIIDGPAAGQKCWLRDDQNVSIGRLSTSEFAIPLDMHLSRRHLMLEGLGDKFRIRDVGSSNGTWVNGVKIAVAELCNRDLIRAGESVFEVSLHTERPGEDLDFDDPCTSYSQTAFSDSSPTAFFTGSLTDDIPVRSIHTKPSGQQGLPAELKAGLAPSADNSGRPDSPADRPDVKSNEPAPSAREVSKARAGEFMEAIRHRGFGFEPTENVGLFQWEWNPESGLQPFLQVFEFVAKRFHCHLVINQSQIPNHLIAVIDRLSTTGTARRLSQTLMTIPLDQSGRTLDLVKNCLKLDALILIGSADPQAGQNLDSIADVLSYPSMLDGLLKPVNSRLAGKLADYADCLLFESNSPRAIKMMLPGLAVATA